MKGKKTPNESLSNFLHSSTPSSFQVNPPITPSLINYIPSSIGGSFQNSFGSVTSDPSNPTLIASINFDAQGKKVERKKDERCEELWRAFRDEAGAWESHRFTLYEWNDSQKDKTESKTRKSGDLTESDSFDGSLTPNIIASGLSRLDRCPVFFHYAYSKCVLNKRKLYDIEAIKSYHYLQYLDVSGNKLHTLKPLGELPFLKYLDASRNHLVNILDFKAPFFLTTVNLSHNKIKIMRNLSKFWSITDLNLSHNVIRIIDGLQELRYLTSLNLSYNRIEAIENLSHLRIQNLYLQHNLVQSYEDDEKAMLYTLTNIRAINLSNNQVTSLKMFEAVENLEYLEISNNFISTLLDIYYLRNLKYLNKLNLQGNAVTILKKYTEVCVSNISNLVYLDGEHINYDFWLQKISNTTNDISQNAAHQRLKLLILEQLNKPQIWNWLLPYDSPALSIIVMVGLQGSKRAHIARKFCRENRNVSVVVGIPYTTKPRHEDEIDGEHFYYVTEEQFRTMLKNGEFLTYQENMGFYYGFTHTEFKKAENGIILFYTELTMALCIKSRFLNTKLILTLPSSRKVHLNNLKKLYGFKVMDMGTMKIISSPVAAKYCEAEFEKKRRARLENDVRAMLQDMISRVSEVHPGDSISECKVAGPTSEIVQLWAAASNGATNISHIFPPSNYSSSPGSVEGSIENHQRNQSQVHKYVSFTVAHFHQIEENDSINGSIENDLQEIDENGDEELENQPEEKKDDVNAKERESKISRSSENLEGRVRSTFSEPSAHFFIDHLSYANILTDDERINNIFECELNKRDELLELHWSMPGLFRELLFTDYEEEALQKLQQLVKTLKKTSESQGEAMFSFENDEIYKRLTKEKIQTCFSILHREVSISDKQAAEYIMEDDPHMCVSGTCENPACPPFS